MPIDGIAMKEHNETFATYEEYLMHRIVIYLYLMAQAPWVLKKAEVKSIDPGDLAHETFEKLEKHWTKIPRARGQKTYLRTALYRMMLNMVNRLGREQAIFVELDHEEPDMPEGTTDDTADANYERILS